MLLNEALEIVGSLSEPSKMPGYAWGISARLCKTGSKLRKVEGSVCSKCYAFRGNYPFPVVKNAQAKRLEGLNHPKWVEAMVFLIRAKSMVPFFRIFDSGDLQSEEMLVKIVQIAKLMPDFKFWLPTREIGIVKRYFENNPCPKNLIVRVSAATIDRQPPKDLPKGILTSGVSTGRFTCPSSAQGNACLDCRKCWDRKARHVVYKKH